MPNAHIRGIAVHDIDTDERYYIYLTDDGLLKIEDMDTGRPAEAIPASVVEHLRWLLEEAGKQ